MLKDEAIALMKEGRRLTHRFFSPDEWVTYKDSKILTGGGCRIDIGEFWKYRQEGFEEDWELHETDRRDEPMEVSVARYRDHPADETDAQRMARINRFRCGY